MKQVPFLVISQIPPMDLLKVLDVAQINVNESSYTKVTVSCEYLNNNIIINKICLFLNVIMAMSVIIPKYVKGESFLGKHLPGATAGGLGSLQDLGSKFSNKDHREFL